MIQEVATNDELQMIAKKWNLMALLKENPSEAGRESTTTLASTVEAIIGAVWIDCDRNLLEVQQVINVLQG